MDEYIPDWKDSEHSFILVAMFFECFRMAVCQIIFFLLRERNWTSTLCRRPSAHAQANHALETSNFSRPRGGVKVCLQDTKKEKYLKKKEFLFQRQLFFVKGFLFICSFFLFVCEAKRKNEPKKFTIYSFVKRIKIYRLFREAILHVSL